jgi:hypothetical protein
VSSQIEQILVRILIGAAFCTALFVAAIAPVDVLPAVALGQLILYRLEVALLVFYGVLLLATPAFLGLTRGRLPIEISTRGAKFAEGADQSANRNEADIRRLRAAVSTLDEALTTANAEIKGLKTARNRE